MVVLNFHGVGSIPRELDDEGERDCWLETDFLRRILDLVAGRPEVRLTVDDGNESDVEILLPELLERDLHCTFFICGSRIGTPTFLGEAEIAEITSSGMTIGSHGMDHIPWKDLDSDALRHEVVTSKQALEEASASPVTEAACPFGSYGRRSLAALKKAGYQKVFTSDTGRCRGDEWLVPRNTVRRSMTIDTIKDIIEREPTLRQRAARRSKAFLKRWR